MHIQNEQITHPLPKASLWDNPLLPQAFLRSKRGDGLSPPAVGRGAGPVECHKVAPACRDSTRAGVGGSVNI